MEAPCSLWRMWSLVLALGMPCLSLTGCVPRLGVSEQPPTLTAVPTPIAITPPAVPPPLPTPTAVSSPPVPTSLPVTTPSIEDTPSPSPTPSPHLTPAGVEATIPAWTTWFVLLRGSVGTTCTWSWAVTTWEGPASPSSKGSLLRYARWASARWLPATAPASRQQRCSPSAMGMISYGAGWGSGGARRGRGSSQVSAVSFQQPMFGAQSPNVARSAGTPGRCHLCAYPIAPWRDPSRDAPVETPQ